MYTNNESLFGKVAEILHDTHDSQTQAWFLKADV
jgi:hypothetical protein